MKLYLRPKGENGLPLHPTANIEECMKSYDKVVGELYTEEEVHNILSNYKAFIGSGMKIPYIEWFEQFKKQTK